VEGDVAGFWACRQVSDDRQRRNSLALSMASASEILEPALLDFKPRGPIDGA
jgi:hypothetical protein